MEFIADKHKFHDQIRYPDSYKRPTGGVKRNNYFCDHCKIRGHSIQRCFKIHGYPDPKGKRVAATIQSEIKDSGANIGGTDLTHEQLNNLMALIHKNDIPTENKEHDVEDDPNTIAFANLAGSITCLASQSASTSWIVDSGATNHMCNAINIFTNIRDVNPLAYEVVIPDGTQLDVSKMGDIELSDNIILRNVLFVP